MIKCCSTGVVCGLLGVLMASDASGGGCPVPIEYSHDDGVGTFNIGPSEFDANMTWMNSFDAALGGEVITAVRVSFGGIEDDQGVMGSTEVRIGILNDPTNDNDPSDAVLIGGGIGVWEDVGFSEFLDFEIPEVEVEGVFYVAIEMDVLQRANPARMDPDSATGGTRSWLMYHDGPNLDDVGSSLFLLRMSDSPFVGAWLIRGTGERGCLADMNWDGMLDFFDVSAFLSAFSAGEECGDIDGDGGFDFFDVSAYLSAFSEGCGGGGS